MNNQTKKPKTFSTTLNVRLLFQFEGHSSNVKSLNNMTYSVKILEDIQWFPNAFIYSDLYEEKYYLLTIEKIKQNPNRLLHHLQIKETGIYELLSLVKCQLIFNDKEELIDCIYRLNDPHFLMLSEDEEALYKQKNTQK